MTPDRERALPEEWERSTQMLRDALAGSRAEVEKLRQELAEQAEELGKERAERRAAQERLDKACQATLEAVRARQVAAARVIELQNELEAVRRDLAWHKSEFDEERIGSEQERNLLRGRLAEEREAHVAGALEAKKLIEQARMRALATEDDAAKMRREHAEEVRQLREAARLELESMKAALGAAEARMKELSADLELVRGSRALTIGGPSGDEARQVPMTRSSAPPRKGVKRRSLPPRPDLSPGGYSMTSIEIREELLTAHEPLPKRRRKP